MGERTSSAPSYGRASPERSAKSARRDFLQSPRCLLNPPSSRFTPVEWQNVGLPRIDMHPGAVCTMQVIPTPSAQVCVLATPDLISRPLPSQNMPQQLQEAYARRLHQAGLTSPDESSPPAPDSGSTSAKGTGDSAACVRKIPTAVIWESDDSVSPPLERRRSRQSEDLGDPPVKRVRGFDDMENTPEPNSNVRLEPSPKSFQERSTPNASSDGSPDIKFSTNVSPCTDSSSPAPRNGPRCIAAAPAEP